MGQGEWKDTSTVGNDVQVRFALRLKGASCNTAPMIAAAPLKFTAPDECVEATLNRVGKHIVLGLPVAIGKPNTLVNAFVARVRLPIPM